MHTVVLLAIGKLITDAFSHAERVRADQLESQMVLTKRAEANLRDQQEHAYRREQATIARQRRALNGKLKSSLLATVVAHDIQLPLTAILQRPRLAIDSVESGPETLAAVADDAQEVVRMIEKMNVMLRSLPTQHAKVDPTEVVRRCLLASWRQGIASPTTSMRSNACWRRGSCEQGGDRGRAPREHAESTDP